MTLGRRLLLELHRLLRFALVGIFVVLVYVGTTITAIELFQFAPIVGSIIGQAVSIAASYFGHMMYSFQLPANHRMYLWRFLVGTLAMFLLNGAVIWFVAQFLGLSHRIAIAIVTVLIPLTSYLLNRFLIFVPEPTPGILDHR